jgi:carbamoyl-phosphate synthase large subunit
LKNILITGAGGAGSVEIWNLLKKKYNLYFCDRDISLINNLIPFNKKFKIPSAEKKSFVKIITALMKRLKIDLLVPTVDEEIGKILSKNKNIEHIYVPPKIISLIFLDKFKTSIFLKKNNFHNLETCLVKNKKDFPKKKNLIVKPRLGRGSRMVHRMSTYSQFKSYLTLYKISWKDVIVQRFVEGQEYTIFVDVDINGNLKAIVPIKVLNKKAITLHGVTENNKRIINFIKDFNSKFKFRNSYNVQLIIKMNKIYVIEINPRISTTFVMTLKLGYDPFAKKNNRAIFLPNKKLTLKRTWNNNFYEN